jgi:maltose alpha-D-glucosyltransferase/alpha-amylase
MFHNLIHDKIITRRVRIHGDYHLGQLLTVGKEFLIADFEGQTLRDVVARRIKRSALQDVATMIRSFDYVAAYVLLRLSNTGFSAPEELQGALRFWRVWSTSAFLKAYASAVDKADLLPESLEQRTALLQFHLLQRALMELVYDLNYRPEWAIVPLEGVLELLGA